MIKHAIVPAATLVFGIGTALAAVSAEEAKKLGSSLTLFGAEKAGNKDGTIPEYTGGLTKAPAGFDREKGFRPDPFADEKPLYSIDAKNMDKYADKLTEGAKALLKKFPTYRIDVYRTHRTAAYPKYVLDNTVKNATRANATEGGLVVEGAYGGVPFPIPTTGYEVMWNHHLRFTGHSFSNEVSSINVDANGNMALGSRGRAFQEYPYYDPGKSLETSNNKVFFQIKIAYNAPARQAGGGLMVKDFQNPLHDVRKAWQYLPGQRRVKMAPEIAYDTPNSTTAGMTTYDDAYVFNGAMDRFDFKLVGKKEMIIPYNTYKYHNEPASKKLGPRHINPEYKRWELHRVWVVEATLKPGKRHVYQKRTFYVDEDSWGAVAADNYDSNGQLYRASFSLPATSYDIPAPSSNDIVLFHDLVVNGYTVAGDPDGRGTKVMLPGGLPEKEWSPENLTVSGVR